MRIWLDPNKLHTYELSIPEVTAAITAQNAQVAIGSLGAAPEIDGQQINATINAQDRLQTPEKIRDIYVRPNPDRHVLHLGDIERAGSSTALDESVSRVRKLEW